MQEAWKKRNNVTPPKEARPQLLNLIILKQVKCQIKISKLFWKNNQRPERRYQQVDEFSKGLRRKVSNTEENVSKTEEKIRSMGGN